MGRRGLQSGTLAVLCLLAAFSGLFASAQSCPPTDGTSLNANAASTLHGAVRYHDGTRPWLGFVPDKPTCGAKEIELAFGNSAAFRQAKRMRNCRVTVRGIISASPTVYYATDFNFSNPKMIADPGCHFLPPERPFRQEEIPASVRAYRATIYTDVRDNKPLRGDVTMSGSARKVQPGWQDYVNWNLNGEKDLFMGCRSGFRLISFQGSAPDKTMLFIPGLASITSSDLGPASLTIECQRK
jgi:hypothetical protein